MGPLPKRIRILPLIALIAVATGFVRQPVAAQIFADDFNGKDLAKEWKVINPNQNGYQVTDGNLLVLANTVTSDAEIGSSALSNLFTVNTKLPEGDWTMSIRFSADFQTVRESLVFGLMDAQDKYLLADIHTDGDTNRGWQLNARFRKRSGQSASGFDETIARLRCNICGKDRTFRRFAAAIAMPIDARIAKTGRAYTLQVRMGGGDNAWRTIAALIAINPPARPVLFARQREETEGESAFRIDYFRIEQAK